MIVRVGVGVLVVRGRSNHLLLGQRLGSRGAGCWAPPGGAVEAGEEPVDTARRELAEETGLTCSELGLVGITTHVEHDEDVQWVTIWFLAQNWRGDPQPLEPARCAGWVWVDWLRLPLPLFGGFEKLAADWVQVPA